MFAEQIQNGLDLKDIAKNIAAVYDTSLPPGESIPPVKKKRISSLISAEISVIRQVPAFFLPP